MVLKVLPYARKRKQHVDTGILQHVRGTNAAEHEHLGTSDRPARKHNLLIDLDRLARRRRRHGPFNAGRSQVIRVRRVEQQARDGRVRKDVEVRARRKRVDVPRARVRAGPVRRIDREHGDVRAPVLAAVRVCGSSDAEVLERCRPVAVHGRHAAGRYS